MATIGVDVSNWNHVYDWSKVRAAGYEIAYVEASDGITFDSPTAVAQASGARASGFRVGAYHFFEPNDDPVAQAKNFLLETAKMSPLILPCVCDCETRKGESSDAYLATLTTFLTIVGTALPTFKIILYWSPSFWKDLGSPQNFHQHGVWVADYGVDEPGMRSALPRGIGPVLGWQWTSVGAVPGINGNVDLTHWFSL